MTSHLSPSCGVRACSHPSWRLVTAASSTGVALRSQRTGERWAVGEMGGPPPPPLHAVTVRTPVVFLAVWGTEPGLCQHCLHSTRLGLAANTVAPGSELGGMYSCYKLPIVTLAIPPRRAVFRAWVMGPRSRSGTHCPFTVVSPREKVHALMAGTHLFLHLHSQCPALGLAHSRWMGNLFKG